MDILKALVEEMNRYQETPAQALRFLNASSKLRNNGANADEDEDEDTPDAEKDEEEYEIELHVDGKRLNTEKDGVYKQPHTNILTETFTIYITREPHKANTTNKDEMEPPRGGGQGQLDLLVRRDNDEEKENGSSVSCCEFSHLDLVAVNSLRGILQVPKFQRRSPRFDKCRMIQAGAIVSRNN